MTQRLHENQSIDFFCSPPTQDPFNMAMVDVVGASEHGPSASFMAKPVEIDADYFVSLLFLFFLFFFFFAYLFALFFFVRPLCSKYLSLQEHILWLRMHFSRPHLHMQPSLPPPPPFPPTFSQETHFDIEGTIGSGSFSTVFKAKSHLDGKYYAIKRAKKYAILCVCVCVCGFWIDLICLSNALFVCVMGGWSDGWGNENDCITQQNKIILLCLCVCMCVASPRICRAPWVLPIWSPLGQCRPPPLPFLVRTHTTHT
jgi:hypothetical protein